MPVFNLSASVFASKPENMSVARAFGLSAGCAYVLAIAPFERTRIVMQTQVVTRGANNKKYNLCILALAKTAKEEGFGAFFRGVVPTLMAFVPSRLIPIYAKPYVQKVVEMVPELGVHTPVVKTILSTTLSTGAATTLLYPLYLAKVRLAADIGKANEREHTGAGSVIGSALEHDGFFGLYRGLISKIGSIAVSTIAFTLTKDLVKEFLKKHFEGQESHFPTVALVTSIIATFASYPFDTISTRLAADGGRKGRKYFGCIDCAWSMLTEEGITSFYSGFGLALLKTITAGATFSYLHRVILNK